MYEKCLLNGYQGKRKVRFFVTQEELFTFGVVFLYIEKEALKSLNEELKFK